MIFNFAKTNPESAEKSILLFEGIELNYICVTDSALSRRHEVMGNIMQINYCRFGQLEWSTGEGKSVFLNPGDFSVHTLDVCTESWLVFPSGKYEGLIISIDLNKTPEFLPEIFAETDIFNILYEKLCKGRGIAFFAGNEKAESIFSAFYEPPEGLELVYRRLKVLELLLYLAQIDVEKKNYLAEYSPEQIKLVHEIHDSFLQNMGQRITIEELSKRYLINPTTLKGVFKAVYGASLGAHIKKHRMEQASEMLKSTNMSMSEIASSVGYESQSKFTGAFKAEFGILPREYRKKYR